MGKFVKYDIHKAINLRSHRKGIANDFLSSFKRTDIVSVLNSLKSSTFPANTYGIYYPHVWGKNHSEYPKNMNFKY